MKTKLKFSQQVIVLYFALSLCSLSAIDNNGIAAIAIISLNFAFASYLLKKKIRLTDLEENGTEE